MNGSVRPMQPGEIDDVLFLLDGVAKDHTQMRPDIYRLISSAYSKEQIAEMLKQKDIFLFVSVNEAQNVTGVMLCCEKETRENPVKRDAKVLWIDSLAVHPDCKKQGYGKQLMEYAKAFAKSRGCARVELNVWAANENARAFYQHLGMREQRIVLEFFLTD
jgi:ribosomal protein S18 acetylase RimI-like enzyme